MSEYPCMTPAELDAWMEMASRVRNGSARPCADCPMDYHREMAAAGKCDSRPTPKGGRLPNDGRGRLW